MTHENNSAELTATPVENRKFIFISVFKINDTIRVFLTCLNSIYVTIL